MIIDLSSYLKKEKRKANGGHHRCDFLPYDPFRNCGSETPTETPPLVHASPPNYLHLHIHTYIYAFTSIAVHIINNI